MKTENSINDIYNVIDDAGNDIGTIKGHNAADKIAKIDAVVRNMAEIVEYIERTQKDTAGLTMFRNAHVLVDQMNALSKPDGIECHVAGKNYIVRNKTPKQKS